MSLRILVTDGEQRAALAATRTLGRAGHSVFVSSAQPTSLAGVSRFCAGARRQAELDQGPRVGLRHLRNLVDDLRPDLVLGVTDPTLTLLHQLAGDGPGMPLPPPQQAAYLAASDKVELFEASRDLGIAVPDGVVVPGGELPSTADVTRLGSPLVVRPALSWRHDGLVWIQGRVSLERDLGALARRQAVDRALEYPYLVQRRIDGDGCGLFALGSEGQLHSVFSHCRVREKPPSGGVSTVCRSIEPPSDLLAVAERYAAATRWSGLAMFEFKRDRASGTPYLLEINARPWGSLQLSRSAGVDFLVDLVAQANGRSRQPTGAYRAGLPLRWWWGDVDHFFLRARSEGARPALALARGLLAAMGSGPWRGAWDTFQHDDPLPFCLETVQWLARSTRAS